MSLLSRVAAAPSLPNGPITQISPYFTRKPGIKSRDPLRSALESKFYSHPLGHFEVPHNSHLLLPVAGAVKWREAALAARDARTGNVSALQI